VSLKAKLLAAQLPLVLGLLLLGGTAVRIIGQLGLSSQHILQDNYRSILAAERMKEALERIDSAANFRAAGRPDKGDAQAQPNIELMESELKVEEQNITEAGEQEAARTLRERWTAYRRDYLAFCALAGEAAARARYFEVMEPSFLRVKAAADRVLEINQDAMVLKSDAARRTSDRNRAFLLLSTGMALGLGLLASVTLTSRALRPLGRLSMAVRRIGEGDLDARARLEGHDEIAQVGRELDTMADRLREYRSSSLGELLQAQQSSQAAIDSLPDPVLVLSVDGRVLNVNQSAESALQIQLTGEPLARLEPEIRAAIEKVRAHVVSGKGAYVPRGLEEALRLRADGGERRLLPRATPLYSEQGAIVGATLVLQDVTRLLRFDELKNDLVATVAHEFRTPLTSLRMAIHILAEATVGEINEKQADLLFAAREDCERLQGIVDDLLDLSRIQSGKVEVSPVALSAKTVIESGAAALEPRAAEAGVRLEVSLEEPIRPVLVDPERIQLVFDNLIGNALRHSRSGGRVELSAAAQDRAVRFEVKDHGEGIPPEYQERIFEKFFRVPGTKGEGIGLGLYISREIVRAHRGEMGVSSAQGEGSRFWFTLPTPA
jgi:NtrC-family two-component system sensor histidine kinase KinB